MPIETIAGFETHWERFGEGLHKNMLIHCTMGSMMAWRRLLEHIDNNNTWVAFDLPGHGKSGQWQFDRDFHTTVSEISKALLEKQPMDLVGHSFGGSVALRLALEVPHLVRSLTLIEPIVLSLAFEDDPSYKAAYDDDHRLYRAYIEQKDYENAAREFSLYWGDGQPWEKVSEKHRKMMTDQIIMIEEGAPVVYSDSYGFKEKGRLASVKCPVLLIEGQNSHESVGRVNKALARRLSDVRFKSVSEAGHMVPITHPKQVASSISAFWSEIGR